MLPKLVRQGRTSPLGSGQLPATAVAAAAAARLEQAQAQGTAAAMQAASLAAAAGLPYRLPPALEALDLPPVHTVSGCPLGWSGRKGAKPPARALPSSSKASHLPCTHHFFP